MKKRECIKTLKKEIAKVNRIIDEKVLKEQRYFIESKRHAFLVKQLHKYEQQEQGIFSRLIPILF